MMDKSVQFLREGYRIAYVPDKFKDEYAKKLNQKIQEYQSNYEEDKEITADDELRIFNMLITELDKNNIPVVVVKSNGDKVKVNEYNTGSIITE